MNNDVLAQQHADLDRRIRALETTAGGGDCHDLAAAWVQFEHELVQHFEREEKEVFGVLEGEHPQELATLMQEHESLRRDLLALGVQAELHCLRAEEVGKFTADLRAHVRREENVFHRAEAPRHSPAVAI